MTVIYNNTKTFSSYPFAKLRVPSSCAGNIYLEIRNSFKLYCAHDDRDLPHCKQTVHEYATDVLH